MTLILLWMNLSPGKWKSFNKNIETTKSILWQVTWNIYLLIYIFIYIHPTVPYPGCVVDTKYPADDVLLQVSGDELHLDVSVTVDSVLWPVLWAQLNKIGRLTHTHTHSCTHIYRGRSAHTHTHKQKKGNKNKTKKGEKDDSLVLESKLSWPPDKLKSVFRFKEKKKGQA